MATTATSPGRRSATVVIWASLLAVAALCWAWLLTWSAGASMGMDTAMGMSGAPATLAAFLGVWVVMMAAMMLPSVAPVSRAYLHVIGTNRPRGAAPLRVVGLVGGYLVAWAAYGLVAYALTRRLDGLATSSEPARGWAAAAALVVAGSYQFTALKATCLRHCRSPLSVLLHVGNFRGPLRDVRVGAWHGGYCLGCCWSLMLVLVAVGVMNTVWMAALAVVIFLEKVWRYGRQLSWAVGLGMLVLAVLLPWHMTLIGL
jgi:predicted metal-binding membrane protein